MVFTKPYVDFYFAIGERETNAFKKGQSAGGNTMTRLSRRSLMAGVGTSLAALAVGRA
jgi:hypothetical protein